MVRTPTPAAELAKMIRRIGPEHVILATDGGQAGNPPPHEMLRLFIAGMLEAGFSDDEIRIMSIRNPARILNLN
jgi:microsomal dipeptidase-like Zn-dependent dipeptidase